MAVRVHGGIIDDQMLAGNIRYFDITATDMTVNTTAILSADNPFQVIKAETVAGGTGYSFGNVLTVSGGTGTAATLTVKIPVNGDPAGPVVGVSVTNPGSYTTLPANPVATTGGAGTATFNLTYTSLLIIPGAGTGTGVEYYVSPDKPVVNSAVEQVLHLIQHGTSLVDVDGNFWSGSATIVQIGIVNANTVRIAVENDSFSWDTPTAGTAAAEMQAAIRIAGPASNGILTNVPDITNTGTTVDVSLATVTERFFATFT